MSEILLSVRGVGKSYPARRASWFAKNSQKMVLNDVSFEVCAGEILSLVGESGSGKSTLTRIVLGLEKPETGQVLFAGEDVHRKSENQLRAMWKQMQLVFQDPNAALNPDWLIRDSLAEGIRAHKLVREENLRGHLESLMDRVGLPGEMLDRKPSQLSGGQKQRVVIARALSLSPRLLICDEAVSALDVSVQAQVLKLLSDLNRDAGIALLFVAHDLDIVRAISDRVAVLYRGELVECRDAQEIFDKPAHSYTQELLRAAPSFRE